MLYREIIADPYKTHKYTVWAKCIIVNVKTDGKYSNHWA